MRLRFILLLSLIGSSTAQASEPFTFPKANGLSLGKDVIDLDLLGAQRAEEKAAELRVSQSLTGEKRAAAVSEILETSNRSLLTQMNEIAKSVPERSGGPTVALSREQAEKVLATIKNHPVVGDAATLKYDTPMGQIGYCFGRATYVHWQLLRLGVAPDSIGKMFAVGPLIYKNTGWEFHTVTLVRNASGGWWVIDAFQEKVVTADDWMDRMRRWSYQPKHPHLRFYFSDPVKFRPVPGAYSSETLYDPMYRGYFRDLVRWFNARKSDKIRPDAEPAPASVQSARRG